jgi:hypothetical protein
MTVDLDGCHCPLILLVLLLQDHAPILDTSSDSDSTNSDSSPFCSDTDVSSSESEDEDEPVQFGWFDDLYDGSPLRLIQAVELLIALQQRHKLTKEAMKDYFEAVAFLLPQGHSLCS